MTDRWIYCLGFFAGHGRLQLHGSLETRQWQPTAVTDFKSVAGKWGGSSDFKRPQSAELLSGDLS